MARIQVARGKLDIKKAKLPFIIGEPFLDTETKDFWIGTGVADNPLLVGGLNALRYRGKVAALPATATPGSLFEVTAEIAAVASSDTVVGNPLFRVGDFAVSVLDTAGKAAWIKVNNAGSEASSSTFDATTLSDITSGTVQGAISQLDRAKFSYGGSLSLTGAVTLEAIKALTVPGKLYHMASDATVAGVSFVKGDLLFLTYAPPAGYFGNEAEIKNGGTFTGTFSVGRIPLGLDDAAALDYKVPTVTPVRGTADADVEHAAADAAIATVKAALDSLFGTKADLDGNKKIFLSQLPDTIIGALEYQGTWAFASGALPTASNKATSSNSGEALNKGDYWVVSGLTGPVNISINAGAGAASVEFNNGDWLICNGYAADKTTVLWDKLDATCAFQGLMVAGNAAVFDGTPTLNGSALTFTGDTAATPVLTVAGDKSSNKITFDIPNALIAVASQFPWLTANAASETGVHAYVKLLNGRYVAVESGIRENASAVQVVDKSLEVHNGTYVATFLPKDNAAVQSAVTVYLPVTSGTLVTDTELNLAISNVLKAAFEAVSTDYVPVKKADGSFGNSPISLVKETVATVTEVVGVKVAGKVVEIDNKGVVSSIKVPKSDLATENALPETDGTLLNENSTIDGGEFYTL